MGPSAAGNIQKTANQINKSFQNNEFVNFSPIPNKIKNYELNQTLNTNVESREYVGQDLIGNLTPKMIHRRSTGGYTSQSVIEPLGQDPRSINMSPISKNQQVNQGPVRMSGIVTQNNPINNQFSRPVNPIQQQPRESLINTLNRPSMQIQQSIIIPPESRNFQRPSGIVA